ncbi:MAG: outer membrane lipoprotein-sorting protein [SAR86 cluster bacterium]|uniref:Outer membrane lipoprotein-sorting protein n=1 Tax=SAR86 cluster bacterium TaxID=2030880 RepID=A0A2A4X9Z7_9GAMM|nr:MAG: outer membrane lipoprotein-sorting protein [SAR86 cluster bacterium]
MQGNILSKGLISLVTALFLIPLQSTAQDLSGREIMEKLEDNRRATSNSALSRMQLSTCKFGVREGKITCAERPRVKSLESVGKGYGVDLKDSRSVAILLDPPAERGIGMLSFIYDDGARDNETWLYLSALGRVKRIASGSSDDETEPGSLFGSEFTTEDQDTGKLDEYEINLLEETEISGREVWKIETIPNEERARQSRYSRTVLYIDKERFVELRIEMYDQYGKEIKRMLGTRVELMNGIWVARSTTIMNLVTNRLSNMAFLEMHTGIDVPDEFLTQRTLTDAAFRETELEKLRAQID